MCCYVDVDIIHPHDDDKSIISVFFASFFHEKNVMRLKCLKGVVVVAVEKTSLGINERL